MSALKDRLQSDLTEAIRSRNEVVAATVRMALTAVRSSEASGTAAHQLSDEEVLAVLGKEAKKRREAATAFADAGRAAQAERELAELAVLEGYLPQQISDDDLTSLVAAAIAELATAGVSGMAAMGRVMKTVQPQLAGRAEGGRIAAEVKRQLSAG